MFEAARSYIKTSTSAGETDKVTSSPSGTQESS